VRVRVCVCVRVLAALLMRARTIAVIASQLDRMPNFVLLPRPRRGFLQPGHVDVSDGPWKDRVVLANKKVMFHNNVLRVLSDSVAKFIRFSFFFTRHESQSKKMENFVERI